MKLLEFNKKFGTEEDCVQYLKESRERDGLVCSKCGGRKHRWDKYNHRWICCECHHITTLTSGTVMHGSNLPLMYWFTAMHLLTSTKKTFSAAELQRQLGHKRYQPIWEMLHKLRSVMGQRDGEYRLSDTIELDEGYFTTENPSDDETPLKRGIGSQRKAKVLVMVESEAVDEPKKGKKNRKCGHIKMKVNFFPMGIGNDANLNTLRSYTLNGEGTVLKASADNFKEAFVWLSSSISVISNADDAAMNGGRASIPNPTSFGVEIL